MANATETATTKPVIGITHEQLQDLLKAQSEASRESLLLAIQEMKKPDAETQEKLDAEKARIKRLHEEQIQMARADEEATRRKQSACAHKKQSGSPTWGYFIVSGEQAVKRLCLRCQKLEFVRPATQDDILNGFEMRG